jgi:hypothetical protein
MELWLRATDLIFLLYFLRAKLGDLIGRSTRNAESCCPGREGEDRRGGGCPGSNKTGRTRTNGVLIYSVLCLCDWKKRKKYAHRFGNNRTTLTRDFSEKDLTFSFFNLTVEMTQIYSKNGKTKSSMSAKFSFCFVFLFLAVASY